MATSELTASSTEALTELFGAVNDFGGEFWVNLIIFLVLFGGFGWLMSKFLKW